MRILLIGYGSIGRRHLNNLSQIMPNASFMVLTKQVIANCQNIVFTADENQAVDFRPNAVVIANSSNLHLKTAIKFASIGAHLFIEKPIANLITCEYQELYSLVIANRLVCNVGYHLRYLDSLIFLKEYLGLHEPHIHYVRCTVGQDIKQWRASVDYRESVSVKNETGGGVLLELSHEFDYLYYLFEGFDITSSQIEKISNRVLDVEDFSVLYGDLYLKNNLSAKLVMNMDMIRLDKIRLCEIVTEDGTLIIDFIEDTVDLCKSNVTRLYESYRKKTGYPYVEELSDFFLKIKYNNYQPSLKIIDDAYRIVEKINFLKGMKL